VVFLSEEESVEVFLYCFFIPALPLKIQLSKRDGWDPIINWFKPVTLLFKDGIGKFCLSLV